MFHGALIEFRIIDFIHSRNKEKKARTTIVHLNVTCVHWYTIIHICTLTTPSTSQQAPIAFNFCLKLIRATSNFDWVKWVEY